MFDGDLNYKVYVFLELIEEDVVADPSEVINVQMLKQMNSKMFFVCHGINNYSTPQLAILLKVLIMFPCLVTLYDT